ncbi:hypothetical protein AAG906_017075 [Vitis piasezkii]
MGFVDGSEPCPSKSLDGSLNPAYILWNKKDQCVLSWINATLSDKVLASVYGITSAREVWSSLANKFASQSRTRVHHLKRKLQTLHQGSMKCTDFLEKAKLVSDELAAVGKPLEDDDLMSYIVSGLNPSFNPFITSLSFATRDKNVSFEDFQAELLSYELLLENQNIAIPPETNNFAFFTPKSNQQQYNRKPKNPNCFHRMDYAYQGRHPPTQLAAMVAHSNAEQEEETWFADSGANQHITANLEHLTLQQPYTGQENVAVGNGQASANLLSINQFCLDNNCLFILTGTHYFVKDIQAGRHSLEGGVKGSLSNPIRLMSINKSHALSAVVGIKAPVSVWHSRLGHASLPIVSQLLNKHSLPVEGSVNKMHFCEPCQLGKGKQLPFKPSTRVSSFPLQLIHTDVWFCSTKSLSGCKYYVIFIDDFSRFSWLYPLQNKSDVYACFVKFKTLVENQFSCKIKQLQSDGGGEYMSNQFQLFLSSNGIQHRRTCPHTPQQNGVAERKHRHVVEMGLSLLAQSLLPTKFWVDAFLTSIFLINRLPTSTLDNQTPYLKLFGKHPDYTSLRTFGCACFPLLRPYATHKLMFRSKRCIFLGYSSHQNGYRCLDPVTQKVLISRHVVFNENTFPAKDGLQSSELLPVVSSQDSPDSPLESLPIPTSPHISTLPSPIPALSSTVTPLAPTSYRQAALLPTFTVDHNVVGNKWVYKVKQTSTGEVDRFKARLVALGFAQEEGIDFTEAFSPVIKPSTVWVLLTLSIQFDWEIRQLDVSNTFLHWILLEDVYMEQPKGYRSFSHWSLIQKLLIEFKMKDLGPLGYFLGIQASRDSSGLHLRQSKYIGDLLHRTKMAGAKPASSPCTTGLKLSTHHFRQPTMSTYAPCPNSFIGQRKRVLRYLKGTIDLGLWYTKANKLFKPFVIDWASNPDDQDQLRVCISYYYEYWIRMLLKELHISLPTAPTIWCDNNGALAFASNPYFLQFIGSYDHCDIFTKGLSLARFWDDNHNIQTTEISSTSHLSYPRLLTYLIHR